MLAKMNKMSYTVYITLIGLFCPVQYDKQTEAVTKQIFKINK